MHGGNIFIFPFLLQPPSPLPPPYSISHLSAIYRIPEETASDDAKCWETSQLAILSGKVLRVVVPVPPLFVPFTVPFSLWNWRWKFQKVSSFIFRYFLHVSNTGVVRWVLKPFLPCVIVSRRKREIFCD